MHGRNMKIKFPLIFCMVIMIIPYHAALSNTTDHNAFNKKKAIEWHWKNPFSYCNGNCFIGAYTGAFIQTTLTDIATLQALPYEIDLNDDFIAGITASRRIVTFYDHFHIEAEVGVAQRFGDQNEQEFWVAPYLRYDGFFWNKYLYTSIAINTGLSYATGVSAIEDERGGQAGGDQFLHFLSPEITFALPNFEAYQATVRIHHRSGAFGVVSDTTGGAQYLTFGLRKRF